MSVPFICLELIGYFMGKILLLFYGDCFNKIIELVEACSTINSGSMADDWCSGTMDRLQSWLQCENMVVGYYVRFIISSSSRFILLASWFVKFLDIDCSVQLQLLYVFAKPFPWKYLMLNKSSKTNQLLHYSVIIWTLVLYDML